MPYGTRDNAIADGNPACVVGMRSDSDSKLPVADQSHACKLWQVVLRVNKYSITLLNKIQSLYTRLNNHGLQTPPLKLDAKGQEASDLIKEKLARPEPCLICRFGSIELRATLTYLDSMSSGNILSKSIRYVKSEIGPFWWDDEIKFLMHNNAGFFPPQEDYLEKFGEMMLKDIQDIDILGSWACGEVRLKSFFPKAKIVDLADLEPYYHVHPWSEVLAGKRVLVIHPYDESINRQYARRHLLFNNPGVLPEFKLQTIKAVQSIAGTRTNYSNWFEALDQMCRQIEDTDFDVAIIGAGAYGLPLAAFVKRIGKQAVHIGGATQILFGIKGARWNDMPFFRDLYNENWITPSSAETPDNFLVVESGCYW